MDCQNGDKKKFQCDIMYHALQQAVKARSKLLYAHQLVEEAYVMREDYGFPLNIYNSLQDASKSCMDNAVPAVNDMVAEIASAYILCCDKCNHNNND